MKKSGSVIADIDGGCRVRSCASAPSASSQNASKSPPLFTTSKSWSWRASVSARRPPGAAMPPVVMGHSANGPLSTTPSFWSVVRANGLAAEVSDTLV